MLKVFFSYSHKDEQIRDELEVHLSLLKRQSVIETWHDRKIDAGSEFDKEIHKEISNADVILLLISPYFMASDYCYDKELSIAMLRHHSKQACVIPVIAKPCDWHHASFGKLTALPKDGRPITSYGDIHVALTEITKKIRSLAPCELEKVEKNNFSNSRLKIERLRKQEKINSDVIGCLAFSPVSDYISYSQDYTIFLMPLNDFPSKVGSHNHESGKQIALFKDNDLNESHTDRITDIVFSSDGNYIASSDTNGTVKIWSVVTKKQLIEISDHSDAITSISFSRDGAFFASAGYDEAIIIYKISIEDGILSFSQHRTFNKKSNIKTVATHQHDIEQIHSMGFSNLSGHIVTGDQQGLLRVRDINSGEDIVNKKVHNDRITYIAFSPADNGLIATCSDDTRIRLVDLLTNKDVITLGTGEYKHTDSMNSVSFSFDGKMLISSACDKFIKIWDIEELKLLEAYKDEEDSFPVDRVSFYPNKYNFGTNTYNSDVSLWKVSSDGSITETVFGSK